MSAAHISALPTSRQKVPGSSYLSNNVETNACLFGVTYACQTQPNHSLEAKGPWLMELPCDVFFVTNVSTTFISYKWDRFYWTSPNQNLYFWTLFWLRSSPIRLKEVTLTYSFPKFVRLVFWPKNRKTEEIRSLFWSSRPVQDLTKFILEKKNPHVTWSASATTFSQLAKQRTAAERANWDRHHL